MSKKILAVDDSASFLLSSDRKDMKSQRQLTALTRLQKQKLKNSTLSSPI